MTIQVGDKLPNTTLYIMGEKGPQQVSTSDYFADAKVALFAVPGAFTPTCSAAHLPSFVVNHEALKNKGIDKIACVAVNDAFVMDAWGKSANAEGIIDMLSDGNGEFARALGLEMDGSKFGMGSRCKRFSMVVNDGKVEHLNIEEGGQYDVSSAEHMLKQL